MTLEQFKMHRPILSSYLVRIIEDSDLPHVGWEISPIYEDGIRFVADLLGHGERLVCVSPSHPMSMVEEDAPGCQGTWWWESDLQAG
jgi:hypothetical protein